MLQKASYVPWCKNKTNDLNVLSTGPEPGPIIIALHILTPLVITITT